MPHRNTICLVVIFRNEEDFLEDLIDSVAGYIDYAIFLDSDSDDESVHIIDTIMSGTGVRWEVHNFDEPFRGDTKRTRAVQLAHDKADYLLLMDADNILEVTEAQLVGLVMTPFFDLDADAYLISNKMDGLQYPTVHLLRGDLDWYYEGILHEYPTCGRDFTPVHLKGVCIHEASKVTGARAETRDLRRHYYDHALLLERELLDKEGQLSPQLHTRYLFYLANSYKDCGMIDRAIEIYKRRIATGGWEEEIFYSLFQIALLLNNSNAPILQVTEAAMRAWSARPQRKEAAHFLMELLRAQNLHIVALAIGEYCRDLPCDDMLMIQENIYTEHFPKMLQELNELFKFPIVTI